MNNGFIVRNWKHRALGIPREDAFKVSSVGKRIVVADGITRDPMKEFPDLSTLRGKLEFALKYPRPSPATMAADIFVKNALYVCDMSLEGEEERVRLALESGNKSVREINRDIFPGGTNYTNRDLAGCVGSIALLDRDNIAHYGFVADCGVAGIDRKGNLIFKTEDQGPSVKDKGIWKDSDLRGLDWKNPKARAIVRSRYRNNLYNIWSYGAFTGEPQAMNFVRTGNQQMSQGGTVLVYSDSVVPFMFKDGDIIGNVADKIRKSEWRSLRKDFSKEVKHEGTLAYMEL